MGARGTDVAREAASLVLVDNNFTSIVKGIRLGRRIFKNLQKSMTYIFALHIPIATSTFVPMLFALPWPQLASAIACGCVSLIGLLVFTKF